MPKILSREYDPSFQPIDGKTSITIGMGMTEKQGGTDVRANVTAARAFGRAGSTALPGINGSCRRRCATPSSCWRRRLTGSPASSCRASARRQSQRDPDRAAEGQARQPLQRLLGGDVSRRRGNACRRGRSRRSGDHRDGDPDPARLRRLLRRADALHAGQRGSARQIPHGVSTQADRSAADGQCPRRSGDRLRSRDRACHAPCAQLRPRGKRARKRPPSAA